MPKVAVTRKRSKQPRPFQTEIKAESDYPLEKNASAKSIVIEESEPPPVEEAEAEPQPPIIGPGGEELCPEPLFKRYYSDHANHYARTHALWKWWREQDEKFQRKIAAYIYRTYPPLIDPPEGTGQYKYIDVVTEPFQSDQDLNDRYGAGDFRIFLNISEKKARTLATGEVKGNRDFKSCPPADRRITELDEKGRPKWIDINDPQCKSYIEFLRTRGLIPEAWAEKREEEMEHQADLMKQVLGMTSGLIDKATAPKKDDSTPLHETVGKVIEVSMAGAQAGQQILKDTIETLQTQIAKGNNNQSTTETLNTMLNLAERISKQNDPRPYLDMIMKLQDAVAQIKIEQIRAQQPNPAAAPSSLDSMIDVFRKLQDLAGSGGEDRGPRMPGWLQAVSALADPASRIVANLTQAFIASRMGPGMMGMGMAPQPMPAQPQPFAPPPPSPEPMSGPVPEAYAPAPVMVAQPYRDPRLYPHLAQEQAQQAQAQAQQAAHQAAAQAPNPLQMILVSITAPLLNQFKDGAGGDDFADWFIGGFGERVFHELLSEARKSGLPPHTAILMMLDSYPPIAQELAQEERADVEAFVKEFTEFDGKVYDAKRGRETANATA